MTWALLTRLGVCCCLAASGLAVPAAWAENSLELVLDPPETAPAAVHSQFSDFSGEEELDLSELDSLQLAPQGEHSIAGVVTLADATLRTVARAPKGSPQSAIPGTLLVVGTALLLEDAARPEVSFGAEAERRRRQLQDAERFVRTDLGHTVDDILYISPRPDGSAWTLEEWEQERRRRAQELLRQLEEERCRLLGSSELCMPGLFMGTEVEATDICSSPQPSVVCMSSGGESDGRSAGGGEGSSSDTPATDELRDLTTDELLARAEAWDFDALFSQAQLGAALRERDLTESSITPGVAVALASSLSVLRYGGRFEEDVVAWLGRQETSALIALASWAPDHMRASDLDPDEARSAARELATHLGVAAPSFQLSAWGGDREIASSTLSLEQATTWPGFRHRVVRNGGVAAALGDALRTRTLPEGRLTRGVAAAIANSLERDLRSSNASVQSRAGDWIAMQSSDVLPSVHGASLGLWIPTVADVDSRGGIPSNSNYLWGSETDAAIVRSLRSRLPDSSAFDALAELGLAADPSVRETLRPASRQELFLGPGPSDPATGLSYIPDRRARQERYRQQLALILSAGHREPSPLAHVLRAVEYEHEVEGPDFAAIALYDQYRSSDHNAPDFFAGLVGAALERYWRSGPKRDISGLELLDALYRAGFFPYGPPVSPEVLKAIGLPSLPE